MIDTTVNLQGYVYYKQTLHELQDLAVYIALQNLLDFPMNILSISSINNGVVAKKVTFGKNSLF